jgi:hypothetical protein
MSDKQIEEEWKSYFAKTYGHPGDNCANFQKEAFTYAWKRSRAVLRADNIEKCSHCGCRYPYNIDCPECTKIN